MATKNEQFEALKKRCFDKMDFIDQFEEFRETWVKTTSPHVIISTWSYYDKAEAYVCIEWAGVFSDLELMSEKILYLIQNADDSAEYDELIDEISSDFCNNELTISLNDERNILVSFIDYNKVEKGSGNYWKIDL